MWWVPIANSGYYMIDQCLSCDLRVYSEFLMNFVAKIAEKFDLILFGLFDGYIRRIKTSRLQLKRSKRADNRIVPAMEVTD